MKIDDFENMLIKNNFDYTRDKKTLPEIGADFEIRTNIPEQVITIQLWTKFPELTGIYVSNFSKDLSNNYRESFSREELEKILTYYVNYEIKSKKLLTMKKIEKFFN